MHEEEKMNNYKDKKILVTGATGFVGKNLILAMQKENYTNIIPVSSKEYNLLEQSDVRRMFQEKKPDVVIHLAGYIGGILANKTKPADFIYKNLTMNTAVIDEAYKAGVSKFVFCIGGCSYPNDAPSPIKETTLFTGFPAKESAPYSLAKAIGHLQINAYRQQYGFNGITLVPGNIYGPFDNYSDENSHVIPGLIRRVDAIKKSNGKELICWGSGKPVRDFVYIEDVAKALIVALETYNEPELINISSGNPTNIKDLVEQIVSLSGFTGEIVWDSSKPDGQAYKVFDVTRMKDVLHFTCETSLSDGLAKTIKWFQENPTLVRR